MPAYPPSVHAQYAHAAVAADAPECSKIGADMLRRGGSVVDAAVAATLCAGIFNSHSTGIGGGLVMTVFDTPKGGKEKVVEVLNARETIPSMATSDMFDDFPPGYLTGGPAIAVPGIIKGLWQAHQRYGRLPWRELFLPTIKLCEDGFIVTSLTARMIRQTHQSMENLPYLKNLFTKNDGSLYNEGDVMKRPYLARTLRVIAEEGAHAFYNGSLTEEILFDLSEQGSIITREDLRNYQTEWQRPLYTHMNYGNFTLALPPLPHGGYVLSYILKILEGYKFSPYDDSGSPEKLAVIHQRIVEAFKFAYAANSKLGDDVGDTSLDLTEIKKKLKSSSYGDLIRSKITDDTTHEPGYYDPVFPVPKDTGTSHISIVGPDGEAVAVTSTINTLFGSMVCGKRTGIIFNNQMSDCTLLSDDIEKTEKSQGNFIRPGKRILSSMCPAMVFDGSGELELVLGASGGSRITTALANVIIQHFWFRKEISDAISTFRFHHKFSPNVVEYETEIPEKILELMKEKGHELKLLNNGSVVQAVRIDRNSHSSAARRLTAVCDRRKIGIPDGF